MALVMRRTANGDDEHASQAKKGKKSKDLAPGQAVLVVVANRRELRDNRPKAPNPWPDHIDNLLLFAFLYKGVPAIYRVIKDWMDANSVKIKIKGRGIETEIKATTVRGLEKRCDVIRRLTREVDEDDFEIVIPPDIDSSLPEVKQVSRLNNRKSKKTVKKTSK